VVLARRNVWDAKRTEITMATLQELKSEVDAGKIVEKRAQWADGYEAVERRDGRYIYVNNVDLETCATWDEVYERAEPDAEGFEESPAYLDTWELSPEPTEAEKARWQPVIAACDAGDREALHALIKDILLQRMEAALLQSRMQNPHVREQLIAHIAHFRDTQ
jgi:hypothetical protein